LPYFFINRNNYNMTTEKKTILLKAPIENDNISELEAGDDIFINGQVIVARDQAHKRLVELINAGEKLPFDPLGQILYYMGPSPAPPGRIIGAAGPTTAGRMDALTIPFLELGIKAFIGKGRRTEKIRETMLKFGAVYLAAIGGAGAFYGRLVSSVEVLAWPELGPEALLRLTVNDFPASVIYDLKGGNLYESGSLAWAS
jgi:fumarate hydratase subunit beta